MTCEIHEADLAASQARVRELEKEVAEWKREFCQRATVAELGPDPDRWHPCEKGNCCLWAGHQGYCVPTLPIPQGHPHAEQVNEHNMKIITGQQNGEITRLREQLAATKASRDVLLEEVYSAHCMQRRLAGHTGAASLCCCLICSAHLDRLRDAASSHALSEAKIQLLASSQKEEPMQKKPSVGRVVHYQPQTGGTSFYDTQPRAAIITSIRQEGSAEGSPPGDGSLVDLTIFDPPPDPRPSNPGETAATRVADSVPLQIKGIWFADAPTPGCWNWPPRT